MKRIEAWWSYLRRSSTTWWINMFKVGWPQYCSYQIDLMTMKIMPCYAVSIYLTSQRIYHGFALIGF